MRNHTYLLLDAGGTLVGVVRQNVEWEPVAPLQPVALPEAYEVRRGGDGWEVWTEAEKPAPLSPEARAVITANHIPVVVRGRREDGP